MDNDIVINVDSSDENSDWIKFVARDNAQQNMRIAIEQFTQVAPGKTKIDSMGLLRYLIDEKVIRLHDDQFLKEAPAPLPLNVSFDKVEGMLLGVAIGDALGATSEGLLPEDRTVRFGEIKHYLASGYRPYTDDTQLTFWTLEQLVKDGGLIPDNLAREFCNHRIIGIGKAVSSFISNYKDKKMMWYQSGTDSLGNGAVMRIAPILIPHIRNPDPSLYADVALASMITHNSFGSNASCVTMVHMLWSLLAMKSPPEPMWWINTYCDVMKGLEGDTNYTLRTQKYDRFSGSLCQFVDRFVRDALIHDITIIDACNSWYSGAFLYETIPSVLYILAKCANNPAEAIIRAVNDTKDNDTIASIVGAMIGALHGKEVFPKLWVQGLETRTTEHDLRIFQDIDKARVKFWDRGGNM